MTERNKEGAAPPSVRGWDRRRALRILAALPLSAAAGACSGLVVPGQTPPPNLYRLSPKSSFRENLPQVDWQLVLEAPQADASLNTTRIALQRGSMQVEYYARASWTDRAPLMVQTLMIESFENSARIISVGREAVGLRADFVLKSELREFQAEYFRTATPEAHVAINAKLVRMPDRDIIASETFEAKVASETDSLDIVIEAFDEALGKVLRRLVEWTIAAGTIAYRRR